MIEVMVVIAIIGVLAAIAMPSYRIQMLKVKNQEAVRVLTVVWEAQKEYYRENGVYFGPTIDLDTINTNLDTNIPPLRNFLFVEVLDGSDSFSCAAGKKVLAVIMSSSSETYAFLALEDGRIVCTGGNFPITCSDPICTKMGFPDW